MNSLAAQNASANVFQLGPVRRFDDWLHAMPHPGTLVEIAAPHVAVARWGAKGTNLEHAASEPLPPGAVMPSTLETNIPQPEAVRSALRRVLGDVSAAGIYVGLIVPDLVARVFILPFDNLPRRASEALPLLRWRLKKSVPFDVEDTSVSWMRQDGREGAFEAITVVARRPILREYESQLESLGLRAGVVLSSTLAVLPLLEDRGATLLVRLCGKTLTTVIVRGSSLCVYRSTEMRANSGALEPQAMLDEVFPAVAYYQDSWSAGIDRARLSGFGARQSLFATTLAHELKIAAGSLTETEAARRLDGSARDLIPRGLDSFAGWTLNGD